MIIDALVDTADRPRDGNLLLLAINHIVRPMLVLDANRRIMLMNRAFTDLCGYSSEEVVGRDPHTFLLSPAMPDTEKASALKQAWGKEDVRKVDMMVRSKSGRDIWTRVDSSRLPDDASGETRGYSVDSFTDTTEERQIRDMERDVLAALTSSLSFMEVGDFLCHRIEAIAPGVIASVGRIADRRIRPWAAPQFPSEYAATWDGVEIGEGVASCGTTAHRGEPVMVYDIASDPLWAPYKHLVLPYGLKACWTYPVKRRDGSVAGTFAFYFREGGESDAYLERVAEASVHLCALAIEREETRLRMARIELFDGLTSLPNRMHLLEKIDTLLVTASKSNIAFFVVDLDHFKDVNDTLGHPAGDKILTEAARRLEGLAQAGEFVSRSGEDSFVIVAQNCNVQRASALADKMLEAMKTPFDVNGLPVNLTASIGISLYSGHEKDRDTLLKQADTAMHRVKSADRGSYLFFSQKMNRLAKERLILGAALRNAISTGQLRLHYQPQVRSGDGALHGVEALARWHDPELGNISPGKFIGLAEEIGEIEAIGHWSLREACRQMAEWQKAEIKIPTVSVNVSALHFRNRGLPGFIAGLLEEYGLAPECLTVEITESLMMDQDDGTLKVAQAIRALGVGLSMDDFGTGFSSLSSLSRLPITELKIDRSFMRDFDNDPQALAIVTAVVRIGQSLGLTVVAEGVETQAHLEILKDLNCDVIQGYLFSRAVSPADIEDWLRTSPAPRVSAA